MRPLDPDLLEALGGLPWGRRSVPPDLAARFCPELIIRYGVALLNKKLDASPLRHRNREHWQREAANLFGILGLPVPTEIAETLKHRERMWKQQAACRKQRAWSGNQFTMDASITKPVVHSDDDRAAEGVVEPVVATCVPPTASSGGSGLRDFRKKENAARSSAF